MSNRRVCVLIQSTGERIELDGLAAALVALVATTSLSPRTLGVLCQWVVHEPTIAAITYGMIEVDLTDSTTRLHRRDRLPRRPVGLPQEDTDVA
jgi:hypothetical protein